MKELDKRQFIVEGFSYFALDTHLYPPLFSVTSIFLRVLQILALSASNTGQRVY